MKFHPALFLFGFLALLLPGTPAHAEYDNDASYYDVYYARFLKEGIIAYKTLRNMGAKHDVVIATSRDGREWHSPGDDKQDDDGTWADIVRRNTHSDRPVGGYDDHCMYATAIDLHRKIENDVGENAPYVARWVANQEKVFTACAATAFGKDTDKLELETATDDPPRAAFDHDYQAASFLFYKRDFRKAEDAYKKILDTPHHLYRGLAGYMYARSFAEAGNTPAAYDALNALGKDKSLDEFQAIYATYRFVMNYDGCGEMQEKAVCLETDKKHLAFLRDSLLNADSSDVAGYNYRDSVEQIDNFLQKNPGPAADGWFSDGYGDSPRVQSYVLAAQHDDFLDWLQTYYANNPVEVDWSNYLHFHAEDKNVTDAALDHALRRWKAGDGDEWLFLAARRIYPGHADFDAVRDAAQKLYDTRRAATGIDEVFTRKSLYPHLAFLKLAGGMPDDLLAELTARGDDTSLINNSVRLLLNQRRYGDIKKLGDAFVKQKLYNEQLFTVYLSFFKTPDEALQVLAGLRAPALYDHRTSPPIFFALINWLPVEKTLALLDKNVLPPSVVGAAARVAFVRAVLLDDKDLFLKAATAVGKTHPFLKPEIARMIDAGGGDPAARQVTAFLLQHPRFNVNASEENNVRDVERGKYHKTAYAGFDAIDTYNHTDNNWWCAFNPDKATAKLEEAMFGNVYGMYVRPRGWRDEEDDDKERIKEMTARQAAIDDFFKYAHAKEWQDAHELKTLSEKQSATAYLSQQSVAVAAMFTSGWRKWLGLADKETPSAPEMLHQSIIVSRYSCVQEDHSAPSKAAFMALHKNYPDSDWRVITPYWFK